MDLTRYIEKRGTCSYLAGSTAGELLPRSAPAARSSAQRAAQPVKGMVERLQRLDRPLSEQPDR